jgi:hypothetical protein
MEHPVWCGSSSAFPFHATLAGVLGPTLIRHQVIQVRAPRQTRLLAPGWRMDPVHREQRPRDGMVGLSQQGAGGGQLRVGEDHRPACLLVLKPASHARAVGRSRRVGDVVRNVPSPLAERQHLQAFARPRPVPQGGELRASRLAHR